MTGFTDENEAANGLYSLSTEPIYPANPIVTVPTYSHVMDDTNVVIILALHNIIGGIQDMWVFQKFQRSGFMRSVADLLQNSINSIGKLSADLTQLIPVLYQTFGADNLATYVAAGHCSDCALQSIGHNPNISQASFGVTANLSVSCCKDTTLAQIVYMNFFSVMKF